MLSHTLARRSLVLGGGGFLGGHLVEALQEAGAAVRVFDRVPRRSTAAGIAPSTEWFEGDFGNRGDVAAALKGCDVAFHLVATTLPRTSNEDPVHDLESNLLPTVRFLDLALEHGVRKVVFASSGGTVYGAPRIVPVPETHPTQPLCSYGIHKLAIEQYLHLYHVLHGLAYCVLRLANPFGERQRSDSSQGAVAVFLDLALRGEEVTVWGDGSTVRDYVYVGDVAKAFCLAAAHDSPAAVFNIGSGQGHSVNELLAEIGELLGQRVSRRYVQGRAFDVPVNVLDTTLAAQTLGWTPHASFRAGLDEPWNRCGVSAPAGSRRSNLVTPRYSTIISPNDHMWKTGQPWYFEVGLSALECIERALATADITPTSILDLPCGHGRVCRMLRMAFPDAHLTACDLDPDGVDFCADQFRAEPLYSHEDIRQVTTSRSFDLIWCGSLFTHVDRDRWAPFLSFFADHLAPGGVLVFTTHGRRPIQWMVEGFYGYGLSPQEQRDLVNGYATEGFGFVSPTSQAFGLSLSSTAFVCAQIERCRTLGLIGLHEAGWSDHQDVVACVKLAKPYVDAASATFAEGVAPGIATRTAPQRDRPLGNVDEPLRDVIAASQLRVSGWAGDYRGISEVRVLIDGEVVAVSSPSWDRPDVSATYPEFRHGHDRHGWRVIVGLPEPGAHRLSVQAVNLDGVSAEIGRRTVIVQGMSDRAGR